MTMKKKRFFNNRFIRNFDEFKQFSDVIMTNRYNDYMSDKVYIINLYYRD